MFYNPKWTLLTLDHLIGWLETKPDNEELLFYDPHKCLFGRYFQEYGFEPIVDVWKIEDIIGIPQNAGSIIILSCATFGEALAEFKALKCQTEEVNSL